MSEQEQAGPKVSYSQLYVNFPKDSGGEFGEVLPSSIKINVDATRLEAFLKELDAAINAIKPGEGLTLTFGTTKSKYGKTLNFFGNFYGDVLPAKDAPAEPKTKGTWQPKTKASQEVAQASTRIQRGQSQRV